MLNVALVALLIALVAAVFGFGNVSAAASEIATMAFYFFIVLFVISLVLSILRRRPE